MKYAFSAIKPEQIPRASDPLFQHLLQTYASETNKLVSIWRAFADRDLAFRPDAKSSTVQEILTHQLLSERRFFGEFLELNEPPPAEVLPGNIAVKDFCNREGELAAQRLQQLAGKTSEWWVEEVSFFDVQRQRIWIFWRRVLHTAHHRTQLSVYLRLLGRPILPIYGPTADISWTEADPTTTEEAAGRG
jgi:uncharacterized damage-inducible protein DinB